MASNIPFLAPGEGLVTLLKNVSVKSEERGFDGELNCHSATVEYRAN